MAANEVEGEEIMEQQNDGSEALGRGGRTRRRHPHHPSDDPYEYYDGTKVGPAILWCH